MKRLFLILLTLTHFCTYGQNIQVNDGQDSKILSIYREQLIQLFRTRSYSDGEIQKYLSNNSSTLSSIDGFASIMGTLYPEDSKTALLLYFFNNDSLYRILIEPGKVIERNILFINKHDLQSLSSDMFQALAIDKISANRSPRYRGATPVSSDSLSPVKYDIDSVIKRATSILLPSSFTNKYTHLIVVPTLNIGTFPFSLLKPYNDGKSLIDNCSYIVAPGMIDLVAGRTRLMMKFRLRPGQTTTFTFEHPLFVCNPTFPTNTIFLNCQEQKRRSRIFYRC